MAIVSLFLLFFFSQSQILSGKVQARSSKSVTFCPTHQVKTLNICEKSTHAQTELHSKVAEKNLVIDSLHGSRIPLPCKDSTLWSSYMRPSHGPPSTKQNVGVKPRPNDRNISTQHIATLLGATCCARLATMLRRVALTCCDRLAGA